MTLNAFEKKLLDIYYDQASRFPLLNRAEEESLGRTIQTKDGQLRDEALERLVSSNLRLVLSVAWQRFSHPGSLLDVVQCGNEGLVRAAMNYDPNRGVKFSSYAYYFIRGYISRGSARAGEYLNLPFIVPINHILKSKRLHKSVMTLNGNSNLTEVEVREVSKTLDFSEEETLEIMDTLSYHNLGSEVKVREDYKDLFDFLVNQSTSSEFDNLIGRIDIERLLNLTSPRRRKVLEDYYLRGFTLLEISRAMGISRERVRQIKEAGLEEVRRKGGELVI